MDTSDTNVDRLLKARSEIDGELRRLKASLTILFTDVVGSTAYFDQYGDTAGVAMIGRHTDDVRLVVRQFEGRVVKTIGDSVMAEFPTAAAGVEAAAEVQRRQREANSICPTHEQIQIRIGVNSGMGYRKDEDIYGDVVNLAARLTKRSSPAQILISKTVMSAAGSIEGVAYTHLGKVTVEGRSDKDDLYEVVWTDPDAYAEIRRKTSVALVRGEIYPRSSHAQHSERYSSSFPTPPVSGPNRLFETPLPAPVELTRRYDLLEELGRGGMGIVYKARDRETGDLVALKLLKPEIASDKAVMARFKNELRLARKITHKNVCRIYEFHRAGTTGYISMEYVEGESLRSALARYGSVGIRKALEIGQQLCDGLVEAHSQGVVHRDLKPENVMLDREGRVKIMDFGIARSLAATLTQTGSTLGTPSYMAPEQAEGKTVDERTDIYAVGLILFEVVTGRQVFSGDTAAQVAYKQVHEPPPLLRDVDPTLPPALEELTARCLSKSPEDRFRTVESLEVALTNIGESFETPVASVSPVPPERVGSDGREGRKERRRVPRRVKVSISRKAISRALMAVALTVAVVVAFAGLWSLLDSGVGAPLVVDADAAASPDGAAAEENGQDTGQAAEPTPELLEEGAAQAAASSVSSNQPRPAIATNRTRTQQSSPRVTEPDKVSTLGRSTEPAVTPTTAPATVAFPIITSSDGDGSKDVQMEAAAANSGDEATAVAAAEQEELLVGDVTIAVQQFAQEEGATAILLRDRLVEAGFPARVVTTSDNSFHKVQVGPFSNIEVARAAQRRLRALGYTAVLAAAKED